MVRDRGIFQITASLWMGAFATPERQRRLWELGITHVLNVGEAASILPSANAPPFRESAWHAIDDLQLISVMNASAILRMLHRMISEPESRVYVHCIAGQNRSPTIVWLYLVACGIAGDVARRQIETASPDAIPGHSKLVNPELVQAIQELGRSEFIPHPRKEALARAATK